MRILLPALALLFLASSVRADDLLPAADAFVSSREPGTGFGTAATMKLGSDNPYCFPPGCVPGPGNQRAWFRFDVSSIPPGTSIARAELVWPATVSAVGCLQIEAHRALGPWDESITWTTQPAWDPAIETLVCLEDAPAPALVQRFDLTGIVQAWIDGVVPNHGIVLKETVEQSVPLFFSRIASGASREASDPAARPRLRVVPAAISAPGRARIGNLALIDLHCPTDPGRPYLAAASFGSIPGLPIGPRVLPLNFDGLLLLSLTTPAVFSGFQGVLDLTGRARATIAIPAAPALRGVVFHVAFLTFRPGAPQGVGAISEALTIEIVGLDRTVPVGGVTSLVSADQTGRPGDRASGGPIAISGDGRFVCFSSNAITLVPNDTNGQNDIFVRDRRLGRTERVNVSSTGAQANGTSLALAISADGRYVAFESNAGNLVPGDGNGEWDIFVHDRQTRTTTVESLTMGGGPAGVSRHPAISGDGRFVAFYSESTYLVPNDTNGVGDVFLRDRQTGVTTRVSVDSSGVQGNDRSDLPLLNQDGSVVAFASRATNLVLLDGNGRQDAFLHYPLLGFTTRVSLDWQGLEAQGGDSYATGLSADGLAVVMVSSATRLVPDDGNGTNDVFLRHVTSGAFERISVNEGFGDSRGRSEQPSVSADGRYVAFTSNASNLVADDTNGFWDTFLVDRTLRTITRVSLDSGGGQIGALASNFPMTLALSGDGRVVAFQTDSPDVVRPDPNGTSDVFAREAFPVLSTVDRPRPGTTATLALAAPWDPGRGFAAAASLGFEPGLPLDVRRIPQQLDALFVVSQLATTVFEGFRGVLDGAGRAALRVHVPVDPALAGLRFYVAALVLDPAAPSGVRGLTNALPVTIVP